MRDETLTEQRIQNREPVAGPARASTARTSQPRPTVLRRWGLLRITAWVLSLLPLALLVVDGVTDKLGAEPIKEITHRTGWWALAFLMITLAVTPVRRITGWNQVIQLRRTLGLFAFFYASLHVLTYFGLDQFFDLSYIVEDVVERPYITVGFTAWLLLIPLAVTSTKGWIRRLGKRWQRLHRLSYLSAMLAVLHFLWLVKADVREPLIFGAVLLTLLAFRLPWAQRATAGKPPPSRAARAVVGVPGGETG